MKYLIIGTPRSGTTFISKLLTSGGHPTNHEAWFGMPGFGHWYPNAEGEASWMALPFAENSKENGCKIVHIIRNPLRVISSLMRSNFLSYKAFHINAYTLYLKTHFPEIVAYDEDDKYLLFWIKWNQECASRADFTYKIEELNKNPKQIFEDLGLPILEGATLYADQKINSYKDVDYKTLDYFKDCMFYDKFIRIAQEFGYDLK